MNRRDLISFERMAADMYRREAKARAKRYPAAAAQLIRWAEASERRIDAIKVGPLFEGEAA